jgi:hypothetical protein
MFYSPLPPISVYTLLSAIESAVYLKHQSSLWGVVIILSSNNDREFSQ